MTTSLVQDVDTIVDEVSEWAIEVILETTDKFTLKSGPFGFVKLTDEEMLADYANYFGNPQAWYSRIESTAQGLIGQLKAAGIPEDQIATLAPYNIAFLVTAKYDMDMRKLMEGSNGSAKS